MGESEVSRGGVPQPSTCPGCRHRGGARPQPRSSPRALGKLCILPAPCKTNTAPAGSYASFSIAKENSLAPAVLWLPTHAGKSPPPQWGGWHILGLAEGGLKKILGYLK